MIRKIIYISLAFIIVLVFWILARRYFPPPVLSTEKSIIYRQIVTIAKHHEDWGDFMLVGDNHFSAENISLTEYKKREEITNKLSPLLAQSSTYTVYRRKSIIFFRLDPYFPLNRREGYIYIPPGTNSKEISNLLCDVAIPLRSLGNGWHSSKNMNTQAVLR